MAFELRITLQSEAQAYAVKRALDLYSRMSMGQLEEIAHLVRTGEILPNPQATRILYRLDQNAAADRIEPLIRQIKEILGHHPFGSYSIAQGRVSTDAHRCYEIQKVLAKALAEHKDPQPKIRTIDHDGLWRRFTDDPLPRVEVADV